MSYSTTKPLQTEQDYRVAMAALEKVFASAEPGTAEGDEFELLSILIADWERRNLVIERAKDPIGLIKYAIENRGLRPADLAPGIPQNRLSEILHKKRALTIGMIRWLHENLQLPIETLIQPYDLVGRHKA